MLVSLTIRAIDKLSRPTMVSARAVDVLGKSTTVAAIRTRGAGEAVGKLGRAASGTERDARRLKRMLTDVAYAEEFARRRAYQLGSAWGTNMRNGARRAADEIDRLASRVERFSARAGRGALIGGAGMLGSTIRGTLLGTTALATAGTTAAAWKVLRAGTQWEGFQSDLFGTEGGAPGAERALQWSSNFAKTTPYELQDVVQAFITARGQGIDPTKGALRTLGDAASSLPNKTLEDAILMLGDVQRGQNERATDFGITSSVKGGQVTFSYITKAGKQATKTVKKDALAIQAAILGILDERFQGAMERKSKITSGKWSNLMDAMNQKAVQVWENGAGQAVNRVLDRMLAKMDQLEKNGSLSRWAKQSGEAVDSFGRSIDRIDFDQVAASFNSVASAVDAVSDAAARLSSFGNGLPPWLSSAIARTANPVSAAASGYNLIRKEFGAGGRWEPGVAPRERVRGGSHAGRSPNAGQAVPPAAPARAPLLLRDQADKPAKVGGTIGIRIETAPGTKATVTKLSSFNPDVPVEISRGKVMAG